MKENNRLKVVHTTWEEFLKEHPVNEVVDMPSLPKGMSIELCHAA